MDAIRTEALTKHYKVGFWRPRPYLALDALTFSVGQGDVFRAYETRLAEN